MQLIQWFQSFCGLLVLVSCNGQASSLNSSGRQVTSIKESELVQTLPGLRAWRLQGIFSQGNGQGRALLSLGDGGILRVQPGDVLPGGLKVVVVLRDRLQLRRGAQNWELLMQGYGSEGNSAATAKQLDTPVAIDPSLVDCAPSGHTGEMMEELNALGFCPLQPTGTGP